MKIKRYHFFYFKYFYNLKQPLLSKTTNDGHILEFQFQTVKSTLLSLTILKDTVELNHA